MARPVSCHEQPDPDCPKCKARLAMREKRAKEKSPEVDQDLEYLTELIEAAKKRDRD